MTHLLSVPSDDWSDLKHTVKDGPFEVSELQGKVGFANLSYSEKNKRTFIQGWEDIA